MKQLCRYSRNLINRPAGSPICGSGSAGHPRNPFDCFIMRPALAGRWPMNCWMAIGVICKQIITPGTTVCAPIAITQLGCWAHARRKFIEAQNATSVKRSKGKADMAVSLIVRLYAIEQSIRATGIAIPDTKFVSRSPCLSLKKSVSGWIKPCTVPYREGCWEKRVLTWKNWSKLTVYTEDGRLCIDNNPAVRAGIGHAPDWNTHC